MDLRAEVLNAEARIRPLVLETPLEFSAPFSERAGCRVHLKLENYQRTGSFKLRGATNALAALDAAARARGVVAASSGNHGAAVACAARALGIGAQVFVPTAVPAHKALAIARHGAQVRRVGDGCVETERAARAFAAAEGLAYVSPYNDPLVVAGQGTIAAEIQRQLPGCAAVFAAVGGGGLVGGIGGYLKEVRPDTAIVACSPRHSPVMHASLLEGRIVDVACRPTLSEATAGGIEAEAITFALCQRVVDESLLVDEADIAAALRDVIEQHHMLIEGAAAVAVAGVLASGALFSGRDVAVVVCGANLGIDDLRRVLA